MTDQAERLSGPAGPAADPESVTCLRPLALPESTTGMLWLTGLPDSNLRVAGFLDDTTAAGVQHVVILTEDREIRDLAPAYARVLASQPLPFSLTRLPIRDFGVPESTPGFRQTAGKIAAALRMGERVVMHCRGGIGRTGLMAQAVLIELGVPPGQAETQVAAAGSRCETEEQIAFLRGAYSDVEN